MALNRREFLLAGGVAGALAASGVLVPLGFILSDGSDGPPGATGAVLAAFPSTRVGSVSALSTGEPTFFDYPLEGQSNVLVKLGVANPTGVGSDRDIVAYSNLCTHMGCPIVDYDAEHRTLGPCPCHFSSFDLGVDGQVSLGQATQNLPQVRLSVEGDDVVADGVFRLVYGYSDTLAGIGVAVASAP